MSSIARGIVTALLVLAFGTSSPLVCAFGSDRLASTHSAIAAQAAAQAQVTAVAPAPRLVAHARVERQSPNACLTAARPAAAVGRPFAFALSSDAADSTSAELFARRGRAPPPAHSIR